MTAATQGQAALQYEIDRIREARRLTGDRNQCQGCKQFFNSTFAFDKHRAGEHGRNRCCLPVAEMLGKGMCKNASGFWISAAMPETVREAA